jgi:putative transposase
LPDRPQQPLDAPPVINKTWSIDFMSDALYSGKRLRTLNVIDDGVREVLSIVIDTSLLAVAWLEHQNRSPRGE